MKRCALLLFAALFGVSSSAAFAASVFATRPDDPGAVYLTTPDFGVRGDGTTDDSAAIQAAIDKAAATGGGGIVFVPSGRYRLTRTIYVWRGMRVIGYGATRPVFVLADRTPGFQKGIGVMVMFTDGRAGAVPGGARGAAPGGRGGAALPGGRGAACRFRRRAACRRRRRSPTRAPARSTRR